MKAKNKVIAGDYEGYIVSCAMGNVAIGKGFRLPMSLTKDIVEEYQQITEETRKSAASGIARGAIGSFILGPVGLLAGLSAKNKGIYNVAIKFKDGKSSLLEVDDKIYKSLVKALF